METSQIFSEIKQIKEQYAREVSGRRRPWPKSIKDRVWKLNELGHSLHSIAREIAIPYMTLKSWERKRCSSFRAVKVRGLGASRLPTTVDRLTADRSTVEGTTAQDQSSASVILPSGIRIEGLDFESLIVLCRRLGS